MINFIIKNFKQLLLPAILSLALILFVYQSVFRLELEGDTWQYVWGHQITYGSNVFGTESLKGMRSSLGGASLTFGLIQNHFGTNPLVYYTIAVVLKFLTVIAFFFLVKKLTNNNFASLIASSILSVSFAGVEATHWVFNMYAYIGLIFITLSMLVGIDLPKEYKFKKWLVSFVFACVGVWYATMRTNGIIPLIIIWSIYKLIILKSKSSKLNLISWIVGFAIFILIDKFLLGQMETGYSSYYIIGGGIRAFHDLVSVKKYDFLLSPASNLGLVILPDPIWSLLNFPKVFSFLGSTLLRVLVPSFFIVTIFSWILTKTLSKNTKDQAKIPDGFLPIFILTLIWTTLLLFVSRLGPLNFSSWESLVITFFGGYMMILCIILGVLKRLPGYLNDLFLLSFLWSFVFLLVPLFMNGGPMLGTYQRYMVTTALAVPMFIAGLISLAYLHKKNSFQVIVLLIVLFIFFGHAIQTKAFFDRKAVVHNRELADKIWQQFTKIVPNKASYMKNDDPRVDLVGPGRAPVLWFESSENPIDRETLFESLYFGFLFRASIKYGWYVHSGTGLYYENYPDLVKDLKKNPKLLDDFYALRMENQSLIDITKQAKEKINMDLQK